MGHAEKHLVEIGSSAGVESIIAFTVVVLAKTWPSPTTDTPTHPKPSFRFEAMKRAVMWFLREKKKEAELQAFLTMLPEAVRVLLPTLHPDRIEFAQNDALQSGYQDMPRRIEAGWRESEPFLQEHKAAYILCFEEEMHEWTNALGWV